MGWRWRRQKRSKSSTTSSAIDVFVTNFLEGARKRLKIELEDIRKINPSVIYVRGTALGVRGPESANGGYDQPTFWSRAGNADGISHPSLGAVLGMPGPAWGDTVGGMTIAGGISAALFAREKTGEPSVVDVSLLSAGAWANALAVDIALVSGEPWPTMPPEQMGRGAPTNPLIGMFRTSDERYINLNMMQPGRYWKDVLEHVDRTDLLEDPRFDTTEKLMANALAAGDLLAYEIAQQPLSFWVERFRSLEGQWAIVQNSVEVGQDPQLRANGYIAEVVDIDGITRELVVSPVQFDETPASIVRAPGFAEHTDELLLELGLDYDRIIELKVAGAVT